MLLEFDALSGRDEKNYIHIHGLRGINRQAAQKEIKLVGMNCYKVSAKHRK